VKTVIVIFVSVLSFLVSTGVAQETTGRIEGRLLDDKGDPVDFANVVVSGSAIADTRGVMSTSEGNFVIADLPPGTYSVRVSHISFDERILKDIVVEVGKPTQLGDIVLVEGVIEVSPIVITASRTEQPLNEAPAAMTVLTASDLEQLPLDDYQDLFRLVPGVNAAIFSAGDISINTRRATGTIANGTLAMIDNRTVYNDFNGQTWWNGLPLDPNEIKQVEVLRGPSSAVWGANAMDGVVNILTKSPREMQGATAMLGAGELDTRYGSLTYAGVNNRLGYKATAGYYEMGPYERPTGSVPGSESPGNPGGTPYPPYDNIGSEQLKINGRLDFDQDEVTTWSALGGYSEWTGFLLTPGGPAFMHDGTHSAFGQARWSRKAALVNLYANYQSGKSGFLLNPTVDPAGVTLTINADFSNNQLIGERNLLTYGANARLNQFDLAFMPTAPDQQQYGVFLQDEVKITQQFTGILGARVDNIDPIGTRVSPRVSALYSPSSGQTLRVAYNRAYRAPTAVELYIDNWIFPQITLPNPPITLTFPMNSAPATDIGAEQLDSFEIGWVGTWKNRAEATLSAYYNNIEDALRFVVTESYTSQNPPPNWPLPDSLLDVPPPNGFAGFPSKQQVVNVGTIKNKGIEASLALHAPKYISLFLNYSWQDFPETEDIAKVPLPGGGEALPINIAPEHRFNGVLVWDQTSFFANAGVTYQDVAFWTDVLDPRFWGPTDSFVATNLAVGTRLFNQNLVLTLNANNVFDERVQQHVWSDIIGRKIWLQAVYRLY